jgi:protein SCO1/2
VISRQRHGPRALLVPVSILVIAVGLALMGTGCSSATHTTNAAAQGEFHAAGVLSPPAPAPALALRNYLGQPVNIDSFRGKAVLVTFIYTHCPDVCPLITSKLRVAQNLMGPAVASKVQIVAVSVDPRGDTPKSVSAFLAHREMTGRMLYLVGSSSQLASAWRAWGVGSERDAQQPELVNHSGLVYGVTASGRRTTIYAANFNPADIAHDVPLLAAR